MQIIFNETSLLPFSNDDSGLATQFIEMFRLFEKIKENYGFDQLIFPANLGIFKLAENKTLIQWVSSLNHQANTNKILSLMFKKPFSRDILIGKENEIPKYYYTHIPADIVEEDCLGLTTAYLMEKIAISLNTHTCWDNDTIFFKEIYNDELDTNDVSVKNITTEQHLISKAVSDYLMFAGKLQLDEYNIPHNQKTISLRDDHGQDTLMAFSKKIRKSKYVKSIINSLPFNPNDINLIKNVYNDGKIEMVLHWTDPGLGIVIQTTGKNYRETNEIALLLKKEYDK